MLVDNIRKTSAFLAIFGGGVRPAFDRLSDVLNAHETVQNLGGEQEQNGYLALGMGWSRWPGRPEARISGKLFTPRFWTVSGSKRSDGCGSAHGCRRRHDRTPVGLDRMDVSDDARQCADVSETHATDSRAAAPVCRRRGAGLDGEQRSHHKNYHTGGGGVFGSLCKSLRQFRRSRECLTTAPPNRALLGAASYAAESGRGLWREGRRTATPLHPAGWHDGVRCHPVTGRKSLFLWSHAGTVQGTSVPEARMLLMDLTERPGDLGQPCHHAPRASVRCR
jgi:hypothetical protein